MRPFYLENYFYSPRSKGGEGKTSPKAAIGHLHYMVDPERHTSAKEELLMPSHLEAGIHARYMIERPGSLGGFGPDARTIPDVRQIARLFESHQGPIWRCFVSVKEEDARAMGGGLMTRKGWEDAARRQLPKTAQALGIRPDNLDWVAAVHRKDGHPHIHLLFWEKHPERERGMWNPTELQAIKQNWIRDLYAPARDRWSANKTDARQAALRATRTTLDTPTAFLPSADRDILRGHLQSVRNALPNRGSLRYAYLPSNAKEAVMHTADWLLEHVPAIKMAAEQAVHNAGQLGQIYRDAGVEVAETNTRQDLRERMARIIVDAAKHLDRPLDQPSARDATTAVLWSAWQNAHDTPIDRDQLLDVVDAVRQGHLTATQALSHLVSQPLSSKAHAQAVATIDKMSAMRQAQIDHAELQTARQTAQSITNTLSHVARQAGRGVGKQLWEIEQAALERERSQGMTL